MPSLNERGFTLVELAVALTVIALLLGALMQGQEMIENARMTQTIRHLDSYQASVKTFRDIYGAWPGDFTLPSTRLMNCGSAPCNTAGNGNGVIGTVQADVAFPVDLQAGTENATFWYHLQAAGLTTLSLLRNAPNLVAQQGPGLAVFAPAYFSLSGGSYGTVEGNYLIAKNILKNADTGTVPNASYAFSPKSAAYIDTKMDDGKPYTGWILAAMGTPADVVSSGRYRATVSAPESCNLLYRLR